MCGTPITQATGKMIAIAGCGTSPTALGVAHHGRMAALGKRLRRRRDFRRHLVLHPVEIAARAIGRPRRMHRPQTAQRRLQSIRQSFKGQHLVLKQSVPAELRHLLRIEQRETRRRRQIRQIGMPGIGKVQAVVALLQYPDNKRPVGQGLDERRHRPPAQLIGQPFQIVQRNRLLRHRDDKMIAQRLAQLCNLSPSSARARSTPRTSAPSAPANRVTVKLTAPAPASTPGQPHRPSSHK